MSPTLTELEDVLRSRLAERPEGSYTATLFADGDLIQRKIMEEAFETCLELGKPEVGHERLVSEAADLVFHLAVGLVSTGASFDEVLAELDRRKA